MSTEPAPTPGQDRTGSSGLAIDLAWVTGLVLAWLYAAGWAYAYRWYARFDLGLNGLDLPVETVLMYGFWVLREHWYLLLLLVVAWLGWTLAPPPVRRWGVYGLPVVLTLAFALAYTVGGRAADQRFAVHRDSGFRCLPRARVGLIPRAERTPAIAALAAELARDAPGGAAAMDTGAQWRLLLQTDSLLVLIKPKPQGPPVVVLVAREGLDVVRLSPVVAGCE